jgi:hypothetical protein
MRRWLPLLLLSACTPVAYAPPARLVSLDSPSAPRAGHTDVQAEAGTVGSVFGPSLIDGNVRARHALSDSLVIEGETGVARVTNDGTVSTPDASGNLHADDRSRNGYTARAGVILQGQEGVVRGALTAGLGGGYAPIAGGWAAADVGASAGGTNKWVRPWFGVDLGFNQPVATHEFAVSDGDGGDETLELAANGIVRLALGLEIGPQTSALLLGFATTVVIAGSNGTDRTEGDTNDGFLTLAAGFRTSF